MTMTLRPHPDEDARYDIAPEGRIARGIRARWNDSSRIMVTEIHYSADIDKCTEEWRQSASAGESKWMQEFELAWRVPSGKAVYGATFNEALHVGRGLKVDPSLPLLHGWDFGRDPCCLFGQIQPSGALWIVGECSASDRMSMVGFAPEYLAYTSHRFGDFKLKRHWADPAGWKKGEGSDTSAVDVLNEIGVWPQPGPIEFGKRINAVEQWLTKLCGGKSGFVVDEEHCPVLVHGFRDGYQYPKVKLLGGTVGYAAHPEKNEYSHCFVGETLVSTPGGPVRIDSLKVGDMVNTPIGPRPVDAVMGRESCDIWMLRTSKGRRLIGTGDHPIPIPSGVVRLDGLQYNTTLWVDHASIQSRSTAESATTSSRADTTAATTSIRPTLSSAMRIDKSGALLMGKSPLDAMFITSTATERTTGSRTLWSSTPRRTRGITSLSESLVEIRLFISESKALAMRLLRGMEAPLGSLGIPSTAGACGSIESGVRFAALSAAEMCRLEALRRSDSSATQHADSGSAQRSVSTSRREYAGNVTLDSGATGTLGRDSVLWVARGNGESRVVYDLTVRDSHQFFANGILVNNCHDALQYLCFGANRLQRAEREKQAPLVQPTQDRNFRGQSQPLARHR